MRYKIFIACMLFSTSLYAQQLNSTGHFIKQNNSSEYSMNISSGEDNIEWKGLKLRGSSVFSSSKGLVTLSGNYENAPSVVRIYSDKGHELFSDKYRQTINFSLSDNKRYAAFHDMNMIQVIDIENLKVFPVKGSNVFAINDEGRLAYYDHIHSLIHYREQSFSVSENVYRIIFFQNDPLFITYKNILHADGSVVYTAPEGRIFDAAVIGNKFYISIKKTKSTEFIFQSYSSTDLATFMQEETKVYPLAHATNKIKSVTPVNKNIKTDNEPIRDPLHFYDDTVYQAIGNSYAEIQEYGADPYLHPGVDLFGDHLQDVHSVKDGYVKAILTTSGDNHWRIAIANEQSTAETQGYLYAHIDQNTFPYAVGDTVHEGDIVGQLVNFPVPGFIHCHFARIVGEGSVWFGDWWTFDNPLSYMTNFADTSAPKFEKADNHLFAFRNQNGVYLLPNNLKGKVSVIAKFYDEMNTFWHVDVNKVRYNLSPENNRDTMLLDTLAYEYSFYTDVYGVSSYSTEVLNTIYSRDGRCFSTGNYDERSFFHIVTNSDGDDTITANDRLQYFNTNDFPDGNYIFRIVISDVMGNTTTDSMQISIVNNITGIKNTGEEIVKLFPNPSPDGKFIISTDRVLTYEVYDIMGKKIMMNETGLSSQLDLSSYADGIYTVMLHDGERVMQQIIVKK